MRKIVEYQIISAAYDFPLNELVIDSIKEGWQPLGRPFLRSNYQHAGMAQAMVKYEEVEEQSKIPHLSYQYLKNKSFIAQADTVGTRVVRMEDLL